MEIEETEDGWLLTIDGWEIVASRCHCYLENMARRFDRLRGATQRAAMQVLVEELGFCESIATTIFMQLQQPTGRSH